MEDPMDAEVPFGICMEETSRGFDYGEFKDRYGEECSIQRSSLATEDCIWLGMNSPRMRHLVKGEGWKPLNLPDNVVVNGRMHLTRPMARTLAQMLQHFADTGELPRKSNLEWLAEQAGGGADDGQGDE